MLLNNLEKLLEKFEKLLTRL